MALTVEQLLHRWQLIEALRSGHYRKKRQPSERSGWAAQEGRLRDDGDYCVMGVACDVSGLGGWEKGALGWDYVYRRRRFFNQAPPEIAQHYGFSAQQIGELAWRCDVADMSFDEIADAIESDAIGTHPAFAEFDDLLK